MFKLYKGGSFFKNCRYNLLWIIISGCLQGWPMLLTAEQIIGDAPLPILVTMQFEILSTDHGKLRFSVKANELYQYEDGNVCLEGDVEILVLDPVVDSETSESMTTIQADRLTYDKKQQLCIMAGTVRVQKPSEQLHLSTEELSYNIDKEILFTEVPIEIVHKTNLLKGKGLWATKDFKEYAVKEPCGTIEMEEPTAETGE